MIQKELHELEEKIKLLETQLKDFPDGHLICKSNHGRIKWYKRDHKTLSYLKRAERPIAEQLAIKKYMSEQLKELKQEKEAINLYLTHHNQISLKSSTLLEKHSNYSDLLNSHYKLFSDNILDWINAPYETNTNYPESLIHKTLSGNLVRSKSESMIDMNLYLHKIPFRYECALTLNSITFYPDFTILHPLTGELYYWEHFGMMDNPKYAQDAYSKLTIYTNHGYIPSINLITTFETKEHPLTQETIEQVIQHYFL